MGSSALMFFRLRLLPVAVIAAALALSACKTGRDGDQREADPVKLYDRAHLMLRSGDHRGAVRLYEALEARFPFSDQARQGRLDILYAYYKSRETESAVDAADRFMRENPTHPRVDYAWYIKGLVYFERTPNFIERWLRADLTERPPQDARRSFQAFQTLLERYPDSDYSHDARHRMVYLRNRLAEYEVHVADYYLRRRAYIAALNRAKYCIENYDGAPAVRPALEIMISAYAGLGLQELVDQSRTVYAANYPGSVPKPEKKRWLFW